MNRLNSSNNKKAMRLFLKPLHVIFLFLVSHYTIAQCSGNLVLNPSFETFTTCPPDINPSCSPDYVTYATSWTTTNCPCSPDYFRTCGGVGVDIPANNFGNQAANTGSAYMGAFTLAGMAVEYRELISVPLLSPLVAGTSYTFEMYVSLSDESVHGSAIAAYFSVGLPSIGCFTLTGVTPQVSFGAVTNKTNWVLVSSNFIAAGGESHVTIGNFLSDAATILVNTGTGSSFGSPYYYIDDVCVKPATALPIELLFFNAECKNNDVQLHWQTATESNNDYFTIERSADGISWETAGTVDGAGNSSTTFNYEFIDPTPHSQLLTQYYRLKQTGFDGKFEYFDPITIENCHNQSPLIIYPNPADNVLYIEISSDENTILAELQITDLLGRVVQTEELYLQHGNNIHKVFVQGFSSGMYFISLVNEKTSMQKFIKH